MTVDCTFCSVPNCKSRGLTSGPTECIFVHKDSQTVAKMDYNMSKIEEMALKAYPKLIFKPAVEVVSSIDEKSTRIDHNEAKRTIYVEGAKAVLEEIEKIMDMSKLYSDMSTKTRLYDDLVNKINELKAL